MSYSFKSSHSNDRGKAVDTRWPTAYTRCHCLGGGFSAKLSKFPFDKMAYILRDYNPI